ncbi:UNVERIFIED_CONTAM: hypothetical protein Slati_0476900 [Sesamum latifolium]|uniref:Aminotransferase-like plant mobile domain-containing protein n=1 Tax=Sesamum latifolium TaxID=2727402 RepID=A0AAW2XWY2_9LAMI
MTSRPMSNSFFQIVTSLPSGIHGGPLNPSMAKYPFTLAIASGLKTCSDTMQTSFMPPRSTQLYTHLFSCTSVTSMSFKHFLSCGAPLRTLYIPPLEKYPSLCGTFVDFAACLYVENFMTRSAFGSKGLSAMQHLPYVLLERESTSQNFLTILVGTLMLLIYLTPKTMTSLSLYCIFLRTYKMRLMWLHFFHTAIPVLASIYRGLRNMSTFMNLFESSIIFPIHYVYGWIGRYLQTHFPPKFEPIGAQMVKYTGENMARHFEPTEARDLFHRINPSRLLNVHFHHQGPSLVVDDAKISNTFKDLFVALRSSYLTLRLRVESIIEAYSPHRFSCQFGFCQDVPVSLKKEILTCSLKELARLWQSCTLLGTSYKLLILGSVSSSPLVMKEYADWWAKCNKTSLEKNTRVVLKLNHPPDLEKRSKDNQVMPVVETDAAKRVTTTSKKRHNVLVDTPITTLSDENDLAGIEEGVPVTPEGSIGLVKGISAFDFPKVDAILNGELQPVSIDDHPSVKTPSKHPKIVLPAIMEKPPLVKNVLEKPKKTFEAHFGHLVLPNYVRTKLESSRKVTPEVYEESLSLAKGDLFAAEAKDKEHGNEVKSLEVVILQVVNQQGVLKKQLEELQHKEELLNSSLHGAKGNLTNFQKEVTTKKENVSMLENTPHRSEIKVETLEKMEALLEESK